MARDPNDIVEEMANDLESLSQKMDDDLAALDAAPSSPDAAARRAFLVHARAVIDRQVDRVLSDECWDQIATMAASHEAMGIRWVMSPERPDYESGTPRERRPLTIYHGHADTGYRISHGGKRNRDGWRIGRRPFEGAMPGRAKYLREPSTQVPEPPCRIFCPVCGGLNDVPLPAALAP